MNARLKADIVYAALLSSPKQLVYSVEATELYHAHGLTQQDVIDAVEVLVKRGLRVTTINIDKYGVKRVQMNFEEVVI